MSSSTDHQADTSIQCQQLEQALTAAEQEICDLRNRLQACAEGRNGRAAGSPLSRHIAEVLNDGLCVVDRRGVILSANTAFLAGSGFTGGDLQGRCMNQVFREHRARALFEAGLAACLAGEPLPSEQVWHRFRSGAEAWLEISIYPWREQPDGPCAGAVLHVRDVTDQVQLQEQLQQSRKLEAVGQLAGGIAHDFNNLLTVILGNLDLAGQDVPEDSTLYRHLGAVQTSAARAAHLTQQLLAFARRQVVQPQVLDANALVTDVFGLLASALGSDVAVQLELAESPCPVRMDPGQLEQVLTNLAFNARAAMPQGGKLTIRSANLTHGGGDLAPGVPAAPGDYLRLQVIDNGKGMNAETRRKAFEPFFTTRQGDGGTGLGLATCHGIVVQNNGHIGLRSCPGKGTTISLFLPRTAAAVEQPSAPVDAVPTDSGETVLLVEDEPGVRQMVCEVLGRSGYQVLSAANADEARVVARIHSGPIHALLTDVVLPGDSGPVLADNLRAALPDLQVLFMSGYAEDQLTQRGEVPAGARLLQKPFAVADLVSAVQAVLASVPAAQA